MMLNLRRCLLAGVVALILSGCAPEPNSPTAISLVTDEHRRPWLDDASGEAIYTEHYRIYSTMRDRNLDQDLPGFMEAAHEQYQALTGLGALAPDDHFPIYVLGTRSEWASLTQHRFGSDTQITSQLRRGGYTVGGVCALWDIGYTATMSVAAHEGMHQFLYYQTDNRLPMWAEEGLCSIMEGHNVYNHTVQFTPTENVHRYTDLRQVIVGSDWIDLVDLLPMTSRDAVQRLDGGVGYYGQLWSLVLYIRSEPTYRAGFERMLADAAAGQLGQAVELSPQDMRRLGRLAREYNRYIGAAVFTHYITDDLETFERQWKAYARQLVDFR
jgi:hypothetical protein